MKVLLCGEFDAGEEAVWRRALGAAMPEAVWLDQAAARAAPAEVQAAVVANPPPGSLQGLPQLRLIQSLWAGVDRLLADSTLPSGVPIARMVDPAMNAAMAETALWAVLALHRDFFTYARRQQRQAVAARMPSAGRRSARAGAGPGPDGPRRCRAGRIAHSRYRLVTGWRRDGTPLATLLARRRIVLINLLPLTPATRGTAGRRLLCGAAGAAQAS
jgi:glyoxylate/hydroxypyruvate reductase A